MLQRLQIENYAVVDHATVEFGPGFNVLTGETGSGKSIVVDALGLLLGDKADAGTVRTGAERASITGVFSLEMSDSRLRRELARRLTASGVLSPERAEDLVEVIVRREVAVGGKGRAFLNQQPVTVGLLREIAPLLAEVHSQNEVLIAFTPAAQLELLDRYAGAAEGAIAELHAAWRQAGEQVLELERQDQKKLQEADLWRFQLGELEATQPKPGEDAMLDSEHRRLANAEKILLAARGAYEALYDSPEAAAGALKAATRQVQDLARMIEEATPLLSRLDALRSELDDIAGELRRWTGQEDASPQRLAEVEERLAALDRLKRKYGPRLEDVMQHWEATRGRLDAVDRSEVYLAAARSELTAASQRYAECAERLSALRHQAAGKLARAVEKEVTDLAMRVVFEVDFQAPGGEETWTAQGWDRVRFLVATNPGEPTRPVHQVASGGELARVLLGLQVVIEAAREGSLGKRSAPGNAPMRTLVFDEIDAGIGGQAAECVGRKLRKLGQRQQVLCVTHLPQIASFAQHHLRVEKRVRGGRALTEVLVLEDAARVEEVARMLAGDAQNTTARKHAAELLRAHA